MALLSKRHNLHQVNQSRFDCVLRQTHEKTLMQANSHVGLAVVDIESIIQPLHPNARQPVASNAPQENLHTDEVSPSLLIHSDTSSVEASSIFQKDDEKFQRLPTAKRQRRAYDLHLEVNGLEGNLAEDANSSLCKNMATSIPFAPTKGASSIRLGTDCSAIEAPMIALRNIGVQFRHVPQAA